jgi:hypothetical protein
MSKEAVSAETISGPLVQVPTKTLSRLLRIEEAAERLLSLVESKGEPRDAPANQKLISAGDTIAVNEGNLWALMTELRS